MPSGSQDEQGAGMTAGVPQHLADLLHSIDGIVWEADPSTFRFTFVSAQAERILGYPPEAWYEDGFWAAHIHPEDRELALAYCAGKTLEGVDHTFEYRMVAADGRTVWFKDSVNVVMRNGRPASMRGIMTDISAQKAAQVAASEHGNFLQQLIDTIPGPIFWKDAQGIYRGCNKAFEAYIGLRREELVGKSVYDIAPPELAAVYAKADQALFAARGEQTYEAGVKYHDGSHRQVAFYKATFSHKDGSLGGLVGVMLDITERKHAEDQLALSALVFDSSFDGIVVTDPEMHILKVNKTFTAITGYEPEEVVGKTPRLFKSGRQDKDFYRTMWKAIEEDGYWSGEIWNRRKSGEVFAEQLTIRTVNDANGKLQYYVGIFTDLSNTKAAQMQIERLSYFDRLTGLPNRVLLHDRLQHAMMTAQRQGHRVALLSLDINRVGHINDALGHHIGDSLLAAVAARLRDMSRAADTVSRHIGDEFAIVVEYVTDPQMAAEFAERVLAELSHEFVLEGHELRITACIGIGIYPEDGRTPEMLLKHANVALHHAKDAGPGSFQFFREDMNHASMERLLIESSLRVALQRNEFRVYYQPQVGLETGCITGMEALVRWMHPDMGLVPPNRFIPIAEETGQIVDIGMWVLREACRQTKCWHDQGHRDLRVAVNVSARQFRDDRFAEEVKRALEETGLRPDRLELELTESMIMQRPERVVNVMAELRSLGVKFSIDDFGTGYSNLAQLKRFPIDKLKIDQSFTRDIGADDSGSAIARAIIALGRSLRLAVVAEGVETRDQQRFLIDSGCHGMQGYLFSRPLPEAEFSALLKGHTPAGALASWDI